MAVDVLGTSRNVTTSIVGNVCMSPLRTALSDSALRPLRTSPYPTCEAAIADSRTSGQHAPTISMRRYDPKHVDGMKVGRRGNVEDGRHCRYALVEADAQLDLVPHPCPRPGRPHKASGADQHVTQLLAAARAPLVAAARIQLVKVQRSAVAQLTSRTAVPMGAVAVTIGASISTPVTWAPAAARLAKPCLRGLEGVPPEATAQDERRGRGV
eukprot:3573688-Prymnesium_polylepis.2